MKGSLRTKIGWLVLLPIVALAAVSVIAFVIATRGQIDHQVNSDSAMASEFLRQRFIATENHLAIETKLLSQLPYFKNAALKGDAATAQDQVGEYWGMLDGDGLILVDEHGQLKGEYGTLNGVFGRRLNVLHADQALDGDSWKGVAQYPGGLVIAATEPLMLGSYSHGAVISYRCIDQRVAEELVKQLATNVVFVQNGRVIGSSISGVRLSANLASTIQVRAGQKDLVGKFAPIPGAQLGDNTGFIALHDREEIVGPARKMMLLFFVALFVASGVIIWLSGRFAMGVVRPIDAVACAARELQQGHWPAPLNVTRTDEIGLLQSVFNDMTSALRTSQEKLLAMIDLDPLTMLPNHRRCKEILEVSVSQCRADNKPLSLLLFDIDHFSEFNSQHGLALGDHVLRELSLTLIDCSPESSKLARYGPDQFAMILPDYALEQSLKIAEAAKAAFISPKHPALSVGAAELALSTDRPESLALATELAVTKAKQLGGNQVCSFDLVADGQTNDPFELHKILEDGTLATIQALAAAVDAKDTYTLGHSQRVAQYAADLCRFIGEPSDFVDLVYKTGTLHDVGKIGVPDGVLNKPGPLTPEERAQMETHPVLGEMIVRKVPQLADTLPGVRHHHERWDGKGYPDGIAGLEIARLARILALADTFDAMTSDRPYRRGMDRSIALREIAKGAGTQFDPELARSFVEMMDQSSAIAA